MPLTRLANSAIDSVVPAPDAVASALAAYARSDLLCHRAGAPAALAAREADAWDPLLAWAAEAHGAPLRAGAGVLPLAQPAESLARLADAVAACPPFALAALHVLVTVSGSLVLGLAVVARRLAAEDAFRLSRIDEDWQIAHWGEDAEAALVARRRREEFMTADLFLTLLET
jgi:chaperone required for assembly of F1-ATPase